MKKVFTKHLGLWVVFVIFLSLAGCTMRVTKQFSDKLDQDPLYASYNVQPTDLSLRSRCDAPPSVKIINSESRIEDYVALKNPPNTGLINPKEMMDSVALYLKNGFEKSRIKVDDQSTKALQLKMVDLHSTAGVWSFEGYFKMELLIPEKNFSKFYEATDNAMNGLSAPAYAIHRVTRQVIDDPVIQDYILCR